MHFHMMKDFLKNRSFGYKQRANTKFRKRFVKGKCSLMTFSSKKI